MKVRSLEVAALARISRSTVSRALAGDRRISEATRARVLAAADALGYQPDLIARSLKNRSTGIVGVVVTDLDNPYHAHALQLLIDKMGAGKLAPLVFVGDTAEGAEAAIARLMSYQVDAVIALAAPFNEHIVRACLAASKPLVLMNRYEGAENVGVVGGDTDAACALVADHLVARGARRFAFLGGEDGTTISEDRREGFAERLGRHGFPLSASATSRYEHGAAMAAAAGLLRAAPDAVFCANDTLACALVDVLRGAIPRAGWPLVVGYDNSELASWPAYDLTSVDQNLGAMTSQAVAAAQAAVAEPGRRAVRRTVEPFLVERGSTRRLEAA